MSSRPLQLRRRSKPSLGGRLRTFWIPALVGIPLVAYLGWLLAAAPMFRPGRVEVTGLSRASAQDVLARAALNPNENVWLSDVRGAQTRVEEIPYVLSAHVHRHFPGGATIAVEERVPEACARDARGAQFTVDGTLRVLELGCANAPPLAYLTRATLTAKPGDFLTDASLVAVRRDAQTLAALPPPVTVRPPADAQPARTQAQPSTTQSERYVAFGLDAFGQLEATLASGIRVRFGDDDDLAPKERLVGPILASLGPRAAGVRAVDLRAPATPVVEFR